MDRLQLMRLFTRIVERASFAQAARDMQVPRPTLTHAIQRLEADLSTRLLERTTRVVRPTLDGQLYYERCVQVLADIDEMESAFRHAEPRGPLRVDMQGTLARYFVLPALPDFIARHPGITLSLSETDRMVDLVSEGVDCVLRAGELSDSSLVGRQVANLAQVTCASPAYLERHGMPRGLDDLARHRMVAYASSASGQPYPLEFESAGRVVERLLAHDLQVRGAEIYTAAALAGLGLVQVPRYRIAHELALGQLAVVLEKHPPPPMPVSVLYPQNRQLSARVRVFVDWLSGVFAQADRKS